MAQGARTRQFLDPAVVARLGTLELRARTIVETASNERGWQAVIEQSQGPHLEVAGPRHVRAQRGCVASCSVDRVGNVYETTYHECTRGVCHELVGNTREGSDIGHMGSSFMKLRA